MSLSDDLDQVFRNIPEVLRWTTDRNAEHHGEKATRVTVFLEGGWTIEGMFTANPRGGFGGVTFSEKKDIPALMRSKIRSVLAGTAEV